MTVALGARHPPHVLVAARLFQGQTCSVDDVTTLIRRVDQGDTAARDALFAALHAELRRLAGQQMASQSASHTLQPTALVNEAWIKLAGPGVELAVNDRVHFLRVAARAMRQLLVDHARGAARDKRGGGERPAVGLELDAMVDAATLGRPGDIEALDGALNRLDEEDPDLARIVDLRFFGGHSMEEVAALCGVSLSTAERRFRIARAWLRTTLEAS